MSEHYLVYAKIQGASVEAAVDAAAAGDDPLEGPAREGTVAQALAELEAECLACRVRWGEGELEVMAVVGADSHDAVCATLGAVARGLARTGARGAAWVQDETGDGRMLELSAGGVALKARRAAGQAWRRGRAGLDAASQLAAGGQPTPAAGKPTRPVRAAASPAPDLDALLARTRFSRDDEERLAAALRQALANGREAAVIAALDHVAAGALAERALLEAGSREGLEALASRFDRAWSDPLAVRLDWIAAIFKLDPERALDRFRPVFAAARRGEDGAVMVADSILGLLMSGWRAGTASSWGHLGVPGDTERRDPRWIELGRQLMAVPRLGHGLWIAARNAPPAELEELLRDLPDAPLATAIAMLDRADAAPVLRGLAGKRKGSLRKRLLAVAAELDGQT